MREGLLGGSFRGWQRGMAARQGLTGFLFRLRLRCFGRTTAPRRRCAGWSGLGRRPIRRRQPSLALLAEFRTKSRFQALSLRCVLSGRVCCSHDAVCMLSGVLHSMLMLLVRVLAALFPLACSFSRHAQALRD